MGFAFLGVACGCFTAVIVLVVAGALLRLAVALANKVVGPGKPKARSGGIPEWDWDDWDDEPGGSDAPVRPPRFAPVIPEPGTVNATVIVFATAVVFGVAFVVLGVLAEELVGLRMWRDESKVLIGLLGFPVAAGAMTLLLVWMLPTTFWRAAMVTFLYGVVILAFLLFVGLVVSALAFVTG